MFCRFYKKPGITIFLRGYYHTCFNLYVVAINVCIALKQLLKLAYFNLIYNDFCTTIHLACISMRDCQFSEFKLTHLYIYIYM